MVSLSEETSRLGLWVCVFILPVLVKDEDHIGQVSSNSLILYTAAGLWFIQLAMDRFYRNQHYRNRLFGYLSFYRRTRNIRRLPLLISSAKLAFLLVTSQVLVDTCGNRTTCGKLARTAYPQIIISISCFIQIVLLVLYSVHTISFNRSGAFPDVNEEEMATSFQHTNTVHSDIGFRDGGLVDQVLEKQADMIRYLKKHNEQLSRKICSLSDDNKNLRNRNQ
ncbi:transmembrane protein 192-like isoform X2 [Dreissena polymorpha]|uniref:transmembrane protein 192-like isoform X2 n=1 Tax=Dreissena polymorpha TaxID=45954 RepID=UPI002263FF25|nr:transmembrane protein 192-like isoform X2 [Dreissena polymorpha]